MLSSSQKSKFFTVGFVLWLFAFSKGHAFPSESEFGNGHGEKCQNLLSIPKEYLDLYQYDPSLTETLGLDGISAPLLDNTGLCGPVCVVNVATDDIDSRYGKSLELQWLMSEARSNLKIPPDRIWSQMTIWEVGRLLRLALEKRGLVPAISYRGQPLPSQNPADFDVPMPPITEVGGTTNISISSLLHTNSNNTKLVALLKINQNPLGFGSTEERVFQQSISRVTGIGHFVIIEKVVQGSLSDDIFAIIRDPEYDRSPYWVQLKKFTNDNLGYNTYEFVRPSIESNGSLASPRHIVSSQTRTIIVSIVLAQY